MDDVFDDDIKMTKRGGKMEEYGKESDKGVNKRDSG